MAETILNKEDMAMAYKAANYYNNPQIISYYEKELIFEAINKNKDIHFEALKINLKKCRKKRRY